MTRQQAATAEMDTWTDYDDKSRLTHWMDPGAALDPGKPLTCGEWARRYAATVGGVVVTRNGQVAVCKQEA